MRRTLLFSLLIAGCGGAQVTSAPSRPVPATITPAPSSNTRVSEPPTPEKAALDAVPPPPPECTAFVRHVETGEPQCTDKEAALSGLDGALAAPDALNRDAALTQLSNCREFELGLLLALRAEFAPLACGDALVADFAEANKSKLNPALYDALIGLKLAAALTRLVRTTPQVEKPYSKGRIDAFVKGVMAQWALEQANAISALSLKGARLGLYGKALVAVEAGMADMRFVEAFRQVPIPDEFANDSELSDVYYSALDQGLEPRKDRGRDAALVGLRAFSDIGVLSDTRVRQARDLLSKLFNGRRIDALDRLLVPELPPLPEGLDTRHRLAARLPTFYAEFVLGTLDPSDTPLLRALLDRGLPSALQSKLERSALSADGRRLFARALFERARTYWRGSDFSAAAAMAATRHAGTEDDMFMAALSDALEQGPRDAAAMMLGSTKLNQLGDLSRLEAIAKSQSPLAGLATYDVATIRELGFSANSTAEFFRELSQTYERAARLLKDPAQKRRAKEKAATAAETARKLQRP